MPDTALPHDVQVRDWPGTGQQFLREAYGMPETDPRWAEQWTRLQGQITTEIDGLTWREPTGKHPMSPALLLQHLVTELEIPNVLRITYGGILEVPDGPETATYGFVGVEAHYRNGRIRAFWLDTGIGAQPIVIDELAPDTTVGTLVSAPPHFITRCKVCERRLETAKESVYAGNTPWTYTCEEHRQA